MILLLLAGCVELDASVYGGVHCSTVGPTTCDGDPWDSLCKTCDEPYDWGLDYPWFATMLAADEAVRPIDNARVQAFTLPSADGLAELDAYFLPSHGEDPVLSRITVFYNHGNYAGIEHYQPRLRVLHELGYNVFVWDYRGYGKTNPATHPTPRQFLDDALIARVHAEAVAPDPDRIVIYGYSLGAIPAVDSAVQRPGCALVLEAPFTSMQAIARAGGTAALPESYLSAGLFDNQNKVRDYAGPLLAMVGSEDGRFIPDEVARIVDNAAGPAELWILDGVEHGISNGGVVEAGMRAYGDRMRRFFDERAPACVRP